MSRPPIVKRGEITYRFVGALTGNQKPKRGNVVYTLRKLAQMTGGPEPRTERAGNQRVEYERVK